MRYVDDSDPDIIYHSTSTANSRKADDVVTIGVHDLVLNGRCAVFDDENYEKVFVSVEFLNYQEELETPLSLIKGEPYKKLSFNFQKGLHTNFSPKNTTFVFFSNQIFLFVIKKPNKIFPNSSVPVPVESTCIDHSFSIDFLSSLELNLLSLLNHRKINKR